MHFLALATDYDGTIAHHGKVDTPTCEALQRLRSSGRRVVLVTGRELPDLMKVFPQIALCDLVVAENGALLYDPATAQEQPIADAPPRAFIEALQRRDVPISVGRSIVATWEPHEKVVRDTIRELDLALQVILNKGAVMVLPDGVDKATGLAAALCRLDIAPRNVVAVGDAENDHAFMRACGCSAAVANALQSVRDEADICLTRDHGAGVAELVDMICARDAAIVSGERLAAAAPRSAPR